MQVSTKSEGFTYLNMNFLEIWLRLFIKQVLELLSVVLNESRDSEERWRRWSRQVVDTLLPLLAQGRVRLESRAAQHSLQCVLTSVASCVLRPVDSLLRTLFSEVPQVVSYFIVCSC
jgi:huntingtin